ncbi:MAG: HlyC/CorC family transporter [Bacteroidia bacterium]|nr:MAG: HlyC/CorC family transporter [Bacteroidia bacterium]
MIEPATMNDLTIILLALFLSAFFSGMEIAFVAANKLKVEVDKQAGGFSARLMSRFVRSESRFISTMLVGNNIALVVYGISFAAMLEPFFYQVLPEPVRGDASVFVMQTFISSLVILVFAEFIPKTLFRINPNRFLGIFALPVTIIYYILYPIIAFTMFLSNLIMKGLLNTDTSSAKKVFDAIDMDNFLKEFGRKDEQSEEQHRDLQIIRNAIDFPEIKLRECMLPRTEIVAVSQTESIQAIRKIFSETGLSKILMYNESIDEIVGYVHAFDFFSQPQQVQDIIRPVMLVPETMFASKLLQNLLQQRKSLAVVVDEFGGTAGIITIEDIIEEIFGEIDDEYDVEDLTEKQIGPHEYIFSARLEIDYLNEKYNLHLPDSDEYETLGGLVINQMESIPAKGEEFDVGNTHIKILQVSEKRVELIKVRHYKTSL